MGGVTRTFVDDISVELGPKGELQESSWQIILEDEEFAREVVGRDDGANHNSRLPRFPVSPAAHSKYLIETQRNYDGQCCVPRLGAFFEQPFIPKIALETTCPKLLYC